MLEQVNGSSPSSMTRGLAASPSHNGLRGLLGAEGLGLPYCGLGGDRDEGVCVCGEGVRGSFQ